MSDSRAVKMIRGLKPSEIRGFVEYAGCNLFNQNPKLAALAACLQHGIANSQPLDFHTLGKAAFPELDAPPSQKVHDQLSQLARLAESYLSWMHFQKDPQSQELHLLGYFTERNEAEFFEKSLKRAAARAEKLALDPEGRLFAFQVAESESLFHRKNQGRSADPEADLRFLDMVRRLDRFYLFTKLKYVCEVLNRGQMLNGALALDLVAEIEAYLSTETAMREQDPGLDIYYHILLTLRPRPETAPYPRLLLLLDTHKDLFPRHEQQAMYTFAQNYCIRQLNQGQAAYLDELFRLNQRLLEQHILLDEKEELAHWHYKNIATVALRLKKFDWVAGFLEGFKPLVPKKDRENAYNYNLSSYFYELGQHKEALRLLQQVEFTDVFYHLSAKSLLLKIYFEQDDSEGLSYLSHAFQGLLRRSRHLTGAHIDNYHNLIRFVKKADRLRRKRAGLPAEAYRERVAALQTEVQQTEGLANKTWLLGQIQEMALESSS